MGMAADRRHVIGVGAAPHRLRRHDVSFITHNGRAPKPDGTAVVTVCHRCQDYGPFRLARPNIIVDILGYW